MTQEEFAQKIKAKYPVYAKLDTATLVKSVTDKYPEYKTQITDLNSNQPQPRNFLQKAAGVLVDPVAKLGAEAGPGLGSLVVKGIEQFQSPEKAAQTEANFQKAIHEPTQVPGLGTEVKPLADVTTKDVAGQVLGVAGLATGSPLVGGAIMGAGNALEQDKGIGGVVGDTILGALGGKVLEFGFKAVAPQIEKAIQKYGTPAFEKLSTYIPDTLKDTYKTMADKVSSITPDLSTKITTPIDKAQNIATNIENKINKTTSKLKTKVGITPQPTTTDQQISELLSPKVDKKIIQQAMEDGKIFKGEEPTMFSDGTPDKVSTSDQQFAQTQTIKDYIPNANKMDKPTLYTALQEKVPEIARTLEGKLKEITTSLETLKTISKDMENLHADQFEFAPAGAIENTVLKRQASFKAIVNKVSKKADGNLNDLWEALKAYDASVEKIPGNIKKANFLSSDSAKLEKKLWLENRGLLKKAITDIANGAGNESAKLFTDMHNMYEAQQTLLSNPGFNIKPDVSKIKQFVNNPKVKGVGKVILGASALKYGVPIAKGVLGD